ncbi:MAG: hypothetical protein ACYTEQ_19730 [Planctomycetota bacterium]|jgi:hypothetical protein
MGVNWKSEVLRNKVNARSTSADNGGHLSTVFRLNQPVTHCVLGDGVFIEDLGAGMCVVLFRHGREPVDLSDIRHAS